MNFINQMNLSFNAKSENEAFARVAVASFLTQSDPTLSDITDIKTAVSEAVTNAIIHGYESDTKQKVNIFCGICDDNTIYIEVEDKGRGIENIEKAREPLYTSKPELERSGMGFTVMEMFMDSILVESVKGEGTKVIMTKKLNKISNL